MKKYLVIGNAESVHLVKWVKELTKYFEVYIISSKKTHIKIQEMIPKNRILNLNLAVSESGGNVKILLQYFKIKRIVRKINPDYVNAHYITSHGFIGALIKRFSNIDFTLIQSAWGSDILVTPFKNSLYYAITKFSLQQAHFATSDSENMTNTLQKIYHAETLTFVFGLEKLPEVSFEDKDPHLFYSNRALSANYNIEDVIRLFIQFKSTNPDLKLIISNDGPLRKTLEEKVQESGESDHIVFAGFLTQEEQEKIYHKARFYISIPDSDSTSVSLIEALAYGCIPIVSDIPANREWVEEGKNGVFYKKSMDEDQLDVISKSSRQIFDQNRELISNKGIFPDLIKNYVEKIKNCNRNLE